MAKNECIEQSSKLEESVFLLRSFVEVVDQTNIDNPPTWAFVVSTMLRQIETDSQELARLVRQ